MLKETKKYTTTPHPYRRGIFRAFIHEFKEGFYKHFSSLVSPFGPADVEMAVREYAEELWPGLVPALEKRPKNKAKNFLGALEQFCLSHLCETRVVNYRPSARPFKNYGLIRDPAYHYNRDNEAAFHREDILCFLASHCLSQTSFCDSVVTCAKAADK